MTAQGRLIYRHFAGNGLAFDLSVGAFADHYRVTIFVNGAPARTARRRSLGSAIRWARAYADRQLDRFGVQPRQLALSLPAEKPAVGAHPLTAAR
ncbi:MAG: hypothetical protein RMM58_12660 [Chloroflexota bacterium]|nr:hypothetical protein [Dehalococcoidia bacterium]MDW8254720.1 hypothetical protein [Chloroflexota bacterium]